ncbi:Mu transposase C-terminal domain-containing protein, partial [Kocuria gwangalliensis]|uniref:Mu transposase C-terminal domain-containing protein n=1 Tax=Kocuria gwangalliensis TaxID=501592 RepID=UPI0031E9AEC1
AAYVSETVTIRYDSRDAGEVRVYHQDTYLCRAIAPELAAETITLQQLQQARGARRKELKQQLRARRSLADALPADDRWAPPPAPAPSPPADPPVDQAPRHRLRTYATD